MTNLNDVDPDKILIECGITTAVLTSNNSTSGSSASLHASLDQDQQQQLQHNVITSTSRVMAKK